MRCYIVSLIMIGIIATFNWVFKNHLSLVSSVLLFQMPVLLSAYWWGRRSSLFSAVCGILVFDFFFIEPIFTFAVDDSRYYLGFAAFFLAALLIGRQTDLLRAEKQARTHWEDGDATHYEFCRRITTTADLTRIADLLAARAFVVTGHQAEVWLPDNSGQMKRIAESGGDCKYTCRNFLQLPLRTSEKVLGILAVDVTKNPLSYEELKLLEDLTNLVAVSVDHI